MWREQKALGKRPVIFPKQLWSDAPRDVKIVDKDAGRG